MKLLKYRVYNFRSVYDSNWIDCDDVTTLVGINESGKSNLLCALWRLNPVRQGEIDILHDMPVSKLSEFRAHPESIKFIEACFSVNKDDVEYLESKSGIRIPDNLEVSVSRFYDGHYEIDYSEECKEPIKYTVEQEVDGTSVFIDKDVIGEISLDVAIVKCMPKFVYYSNYGNLSSRIYLPHAVEWLEGRKVTGIDENEEQTRTLRVLFDFVNLKPKEILELGKSPEDLANERRSSSTPNEKEIVDAKNAKEKRTIILQSASASLTQKFKDWWRQGEYKFRFQADGDYFTIWVSDLKRPEEVALELRSTGLQWFLSFYLIFLVESEQENKDAILLLDEAGLTLHPTAQKDLSLFFDNLSKKNQIINTTHSPFIVDTDRIDRCRVVYSDKAGHTVVSSNLRASEDSVNTQSIYALHAALGLSVSDVLLQGCQPIIVEGVSDQIYMNAIKTYLISRNLIKPRFELVFVPVGGVKGIQPVSSLLCGINSCLPFALVDSDKSGKDIKNKMKSGLYKDDIGKIIEIETFTGKKNSEIEDLLPYDLCDKGIWSLFNSVEDNSFDDVYQSDECLLPQIEQFAKENGIVLDRGWKVDFAKQIRKFMMTDRGMSKITPEIEGMWKKLFESFI